jgi:hypothetical protein
MVMKLPVESHSKLSLTYSSYSNLGRRAGKWSLRFHGRSVAVVLEQHMVASCGTSSILNRNKSGW